MNDSILLTESRDSCVDLKDDIVNSLSTSTPAVDEANLEEIDPFELLSAEIEMSRNRPQPIASTSKLPSNPSITTTILASRSSEELINNAALAQERRSRQSVGLATKDSQRDTHRSSFSTISPMTPVPSQNRSLSTSAPFSSSLQTWTTTSIENNKILAQQLRSPQRVKSQPRSAPLPPRPPLPPLPPLPPRPPRSTRPPLRFTSHRSLVPSVYLPNETSDDRWAVLNYKQIPVVENNYRRRSPEPYFSRGRSRGRSRSESPERSRTSSRQTVRSTEESARRPARKLAESDAKMRKAKERQIVDDQKRRKESADREAARQKARLVETVVSPIFEDVAEETESYEEVEIDKGELEEGEVQEIKRVKLSRTLNDRGEKSKNMSYVLSTHFILSRTKFTDNLMSSRHPDNLIRDSRSQILDYGSSALMPSRMSSPHMSSTTADKTVALPTSVITEFEETAPSSNLDSYPSPSPSPSPAHDSLQLFRLSGVAILRHQL